jgi:hypothetical protein
MIEIPQDDTEFEAATIKEVRDSSTYWSIATTNSYCFSLEKKHGVEPKVGDKIRVYGTFGHPIRGVVVNGVVAFYRTAGEQDEINRQAAQKMREDKLREYEAKKGEIEAAVAAFPPEFQARIARFWRNNPTFWEFLPYELFCCQEAVKIAARFKTAEGIHAFYDLPYERQREAAPDLSDQHSGNTFGTACALAQCYVSQPGLLDKMHGALCPLVGCKSYGCYSVEAQA